MKKSRQSCGPLPGPFNLSGLGCSINAPIDLDPCDRFEGKEHVTSESETEVDSPSYGV